MLPSEMAEFSKKGPFRWFLANQVDMQIRDVRAMLKLPHPDVEPDAGCNFAAASMLSNLLCGISVVLFMPSQKILNTEKGSYDHALKKVANIQTGPRFREMMIRFYPWSSTENPRDVSDFLYNYIRNPLSHSLGLWQGRPFRIFVNKSPLREGQISELEESTERPSWIPDTLSSSGDNRYVSVSTLYWGIYQVFRGLAEDEQQMSAAIGTLQTYGWFVGRTN